MAGEALPPPPDSYVVGVAIPPDDTKAPLASYPIRPNRLDELAAGSETKAKSAVCPDHANALVTSRNVPA
jgi:hypothetical protein